MRTIDLSQPANQHNPFVVPDGYFAAFAERMMQRIAAAQPAPAPAQPFMRWIPWLGAACVIALSVLFTQLAPSNNVETDAQTAQTAETSAADEAYDYIMMADADNFVNYGTDF